MSEEINQEHIKILDKSYTIACPAEERHALLDSARLLDDKMRHIRDNDKVIGNERIAIIAALNLAHELLQERQGGISDEVSARFGALTAKIEAELQG